LTLSVEVIVMTSLVCHHIYLVVVTGARVVGFGAGGVAFGVVFGAGVVLG
jgi:hypothetical protein